jgi:hypothetical protein
MRCIVPIRVNHLHPSFGYQLKITEGWLRGLKQPHFGAVHGSYRVGGSNPFPLRHAAKARRIAANITNLPSVPPQILKDIPRPPNSASLDD